MKTIKTLFAILFLCTMFIACEADKLEEEVGIENINTIGEDTAGEEVQPANGSSGG